MAVSATGILTIGRVKDYLQLTEHSAILEKIVDGVSAQLEAYLNRKIRSQSYSELIPRPCGNLITLQQPDITSVKGLFIDTFSALRLRYTGSDTVARVEVKADEVTLLTRLGATETITQIDFDTDTTMAAVATEMPADWEATVLNEGPSAYLVRMGMRSAKDAYVTLEAWEDYDGDYSVDYATGLIELHAHYAGHLSVHPWIRVDYVAGKDVPADVELVALEMIQQAWTMRGTDGTVQSESEGDYSVTYRVPELTSEWKRRISTHRRVTP